MRPAECCRASNSSALSLSTESYLDSLQASCVLSRVCFSTTSHGSASHDTARNFPESLCTEPRGPLKSVCFHRGLQCTSTVPSWWRTSAPCHNLVYCLLWSQDALLLHHTGVVIAGGAIEQEVAVTVAGMLEMPPQATCVLG